ncbi:dephospho-CoA kinase [Candidatus Symbiothrix dinenymphae]|nr:dephospho-CoA kinase [Candidatus Symbiothrix dinenymphae]
MTTIGITGGIGSGKSIVSKLLDINGIPVYDSDREAKRLTANSPAIREKLTARFGTGLYSDGQLDKTRLASLIFNDKTALEYVNSVIHPEVARDFSEWKKQHEATNRAVALESAILFESGFAQLTDVTVTVSAPLQTKIERVKRRDNLSEQAITERISNQMTDEVRAQLADYALVNDDRQALIPQVEHLLRCKK